MRKFFRGAAQKFKGSYWLSSGSYSLINKITSMFFGLANFYILLHDSNAELRPHTKFTADDYGTWVLYYTVINLMEMSKQGFVRNPLIRFLNINSIEESPKIQSASFYLNSIIGGIEVLLLGVGALLLDDLWDAPKLTYLFLIYMGATIALIPINHFDIVQQARFQFKGTTISNLIRQGGLFSFIAFIFVFGRLLHIEPMASYEFDLIALGFVQCGSILLSGIVSYFYARKFVSFSKIIDKTWVKQLFDYGVFTFGTNVSSTIYKSIDTWMLGTMISKTAVTIFAPAIRVSNLVEVPTDTLTSVLFPKLSQRISTEGMSTAKYLYEKAVGTLTAIMLPAVLTIIVFANEVIYIIAGPGFGETVPILRITMLFGLIIPFNRLMGITLDAIGKAKTNFAYVLLNTCINIISNYFFIKQYGIIGAAYGTLTTYLISLVYNQYYLYHNLNVRLTGVFKHFIDFYLKIFSTGIKFLKRTSA
jgi:O-antigen/teichoic acid export membrane protein